MNYQEFISYLKDPLLVEEGVGEEVRVLLDKYPYFNLLRWIYLRSLYVEDSLDFEIESKKTAAFSSDRRGLFYFIFPTQNVRPAERILREDSDGSYFDMVDALEKKGKTDENSLRNLAEKLKKARTRLQNKQDDSALPEINLEQKESQFALVANEGQDGFTRVTEELAKELIREKKYAEAIQILEKLNLIYPKKSIYFADQIRFLKKIIDY